MKISTRGRYALRMMIDLAEHNSGEYIPLKEIAERQNISLKYLEQIVTMLTKAGMVRGVRGAGGGYKLANPPENYTAGSVLRVTEGELVPVTCFSGRDECCENFANCSTTKFWKGLQDVIDTYVDSVTLKDLITNSSTTQYVNFVI